MQQFNKWIEKRALKETFNDEEEFSDKFKFNNSESDFADDYEHTSNELIKIILNRYPAESSQFFNTLIDRGDDEVKNLVEKLSKEKTTSTETEPDHSSDQDEVVPCIADVGHSGDGSNYE